MLEARGFSRAARADDAPCSFAAARELSKQHRHRLNPPHGAGQYAEEPSAGHLRGMALSRRDVALASVAAFISWGFLTNWIPTLRFLPYAFLAGAISTLALLSWIVISTSRGTRYGLDYPPRTRSLAFTSPQAWKEEIAALKNKLKHRREPIIRKSFIISDAFESILELILRDFVQSWYGNISSSPSFSNEVDCVLRAALGNIRDRIVALDVIQIAVSRFIPIVTSHMREFYEAERLVRGTNLTRDLTESDELDNAIAGKYRNGRLHPAASLAISDGKLLQQQHLRKTVEKITLQVLPSSMTTSSAVLIMMREITTCAVLFPVVQMLADPDFINQLMDANGRMLLQDRKTVRRLRAALDEHATPVSAGLLTTVFPRLAPGDDQRKFERFMRAIRRCSNISDVRRFRNEVASQLKRAEAVEGQKSIYVRRLHAGKQALDQRIAILSATGPANSALNGKSGSHPNGSRSRSEKSSLRQLLYDASGLSYFMEYMDRLRLMSLVQFWIVVDGMRNPLEDESGDHEKAPSQFQFWTNADRNDLVQITEAYLQRPEIIVSNQAREAVRSFLAAGSRATMAQYLAARGAILQTQTAVYEEMVNKHFPNFQRSDLYYKYVASDDASPSEPLTIGLPAFLDGKSASTERLPKPARLPRPNGKESDLRRAVASSSDLKAFLKTSEAQRESRRSLDESGPRRKLFDDDDEDDPLTRSTLSLESDQGSTVNSDVDGSRAVDAVHAALTDIMDDNHDGESLFSETGVGLPKDTHVPTPSVDEPFPDGGVMSPPPLGKVMPSIASLGLVGAPSRHGVFSEDDLFGEEEKFIEDEHTSELSDKTDTDEDIQEAAPGDLGLIEAIEALRKDLERLRAQDAIIDSLHKKAELTNNAAELRILRKSKASLQREIQRKELQRQRYVVQESDNGLHGRATISINSIMVGTEADGKEYALYVIEVKRQAGEQMPAATWAVARRYNEFHALHRRLRSRYPALRDLHIPRRELVLKFQKGFLRKRRAALERYLQELIRIPAVCRSREFRAFLSQQAILSNESTDQQIDNNDFATRIYNSVADGMEEFLGNVPVLDQLSLAGQTLISAATTQLNGGPVVPRIPNDLATAAEAETELEAFENRELEPFVKPICDLFLEIFELNRGNNWLRGRAVVIVLQQLLGGTIERKVRENFKSLTQESAALKYISMLKDSLWPGGELKGPSPPRTEDEKARTRREAGLVLATLIPEMAGSIVGRANAVAAGRRVFATLNNRRLNTHLVFTLLDELMYVLFPDAELR